MGEGEPETAASSPRAELGIDNLGELILGRLDVFPPGDVGAARALSALLRLDPNTPLDDVVGRFGDHRGYLYFCGLAGNLLKKGFIHAAPRIEC